VDRRRFGGRARAAVGVIGTRIAAGAGGGERVERPHRPPPKWLAELDTYEVAEELSLAHDSDLGEMLRARIVGREESGARIGRPCARVRAARLCEGRWRVG
jgi:hypothetical protein